MIGGQDLGSSFTNSVIVTAISVPLTLFLASLAGYAISRLKGFMAWAIFGFLVLGMAIPAQANMVPLYVLFGRLGLLDSLAGLIAGQRGVHPAHRRLHPRRIHADPAQGTLRSILD